MNFIKAKSIYNPLLIKFIIVFFSKNKYFQFFTLQTFLKFYLIRDLIY